MHHGKYVFAQVMELLSQYDFNKCVDTWNGHKAVKQLSCREQFLAMAFGQLAYRESLRDVVTCLFAQRTKLYHLGFRTPVAKSTLAKANERRDWRIYRDFALVLIQRARTLYRDDPAFTLDLDGSCYAIDSTSIEMCLSIFPWAPYMQTAIQHSGAVKLHLLMDMRGSIPTFFHITHGKVHDIKFLDHLHFECGAYYVLDKGYHDFARFFAITNAGAFFVTRAKTTMAARRLYSNPCDTSGGLRCDQVIRLTPPTSRMRYPHTLRRIKYYDADTKRYYVFLTNNFSISAQTVADLYKHRWQIELYFKWIKQHLKIKTFWGHSRNAVQTQICIALCTYLIVAILKKRLQIERNLYEILQILSVSLFDTTPLVELFSHAPLQEIDTHLQAALPLLDI